MTRSTREFSLAQAIHRNAKSLAQAQNTYKQNLVFVNTFITGVLSSSLPQLNQPPPDWLNFVRSYEMATEEALTWVNDVMAHLLNVPGAVQSYDTVVALLLQDAIAQATSLQSTPDNGMALEVLQDDLANLNDLFGQVIAFISAVISRLENFQNVLPGMATQLQSIAQASINDANADRQQIANLNTQIQQLQSDMASLSAQIIAAGSGDPEAVTLGLVGIMTDWPGGALLWIVLGPAVASSATIIGLDEAKIENDQKQISVLQGQINAITADVSTLALLANGYGVMASQTQQIQTDLQAMLGQWQTLEDDVANAVSDIQSAIVESDTGAAVFEAVAAELNDAVMNWNAASAEVGALTVQLQVNNAPLQVGMSSAMVGQALEGGRTVDILTYYNHGSAVAMSRRRAA